MARRVLRRQAILSECHPLQREVILDPCRSKAILAGRRSGKSEMDARFIAASLEACGRDEWVQYSAVTRIIAKDLIWSKLTGVASRHGLGWEMREREGVIITPRGGKFRVLGWDDAGEVEKSAGYKTRAYVADEPHSYAEKLRYLYEQKIGPALSDLAGTFIVNGTPGIAPSGWWYETSTGKTPGFKCWHWTVRNNPHYPRDPEEMLREELKRNAWTVETAAFRREYLAEWCQEEDELVYAYVADRNLCDAVELDPAGMFTLGIDFGFVDPCAWVVLYSPPHRKETYVVHVEQHSRLLPDEVMDVTARIVQRYRPSAIVGDPGGPGKPYIEQWNRRYAHAVGLHVKGAQKTEKVANIEILNGEFRQPRLFLVREETRALVDELQGLVWADERRDKEHPSCNNHCTDAMLYASREHLGYLQTIKEDAPTDPEEVARLERMARVAEAARKRQEEEDAYW